ncbi:2742_t:CDS:2, partial [Dentiscutata heterogama]
LLEQLALESGCILTWDKHNPEEETWQPNNKYEKNQPSLDEAYSDNENVETWWLPKEDDCIADQDWENNWYDDAKECKVFMIKVKNGDSEKKLSKSTERRFVIEKYWKELEYRKLVLEAFESDDESTQSRDVVIMRETVSENCKENTNPETDEKENDEF